METGFLNFHDEEHFSDFSLSLEQNLMEKPQDLLMHIVENDFDYMETHLDVANSDSLWSNDNEHNEEMGELSISEIATVPKIDNIKEDFAKVLTDWQEHIGYLQASDMDEYMDIIGLSMNATDKKTFYAPENILQDEASTHTTESDFLMTEQENPQKNNLHISQHISGSENYSKDIDNTIQENIFHTTDDVVEDDGKKIKTESETNEAPHEEPKLSLQIKDTAIKDTPKHETQGIDVSSKVSTKQKKKKKGKGTLCKQNTENDDCVDIETISDELPVLEAGDVKSLLEQFEASENTAMSSLSSTKKNIESNQVTHTKSTKIRQILNQSQSVVAKKSVPQVSNLHKNIRDSLPKEVIDRIKASGRKRVISVIPAMPNTQSGSRSNGTRMQDAAATLSRNKLLKIVTNNTKSRTVDGGLVQLDHDYCSSASSSISSSDSNSEYERQSSDSEKTTPVKDNASRQSRCYAAYVKQASVAQSTQGRNPTKSGEYWTEGNSKKDSGLESGEVSDASEEQSGATSFNSVQDNELTKQLQSEVKDCQKETTLEQPNSKQFCSSSNNLSQSTQIQNESPSKPSQTHEMKIRSALATSILQLRQGVLTKTKTVKGGHRMKQMVSVLKKPPNAPQPPVLMTNPNESIVTTTNSSNDEVQNIIVQDNQEVSSQEEEKKPPRRKLNLAEYRSRREQNRSDNSRTNSPIQPMTLVYVHHASTTTEPIKDDPENVIWSEREIVSVLKPKVDIDEEKLRPKPSTCDIGIQTYETVFEFPTTSLVDIDDRNGEQRDKQIRDRKQRPYRKQRITSSSSRSRSRSKSRSRSRSRSRNRSRSRSRSRRRSNTRRRRISHRRSSVSSSSSWSSRSRSHTRSTSSSRSRYSRSRSRSSRSRSRSSSRYSSCSRSSSRSNFGRSKWSSRRRRGRRDRRRSYDRHRRRSSGSYRGCRDWRRSPSNSYRKPYDAWYDREKQRQVEERRVIYVGRLDEGITKADLRRRFEVFGPVVDISVHFREHGDNYGFVTFAYKNDAYEAVEHGNDDPSLPRYDLCFGGRRAFCKVKYADLDGMASNSPGSGRGPQMNQDNTFDLLLKEAKAKLRKRKV